MTAKRVQTVRPFFEPTSIAVVGASTNSDRGGNRILQNLIQQFDGEIYPVNPGSDEVLGLRCYPSVTSIPGHVDLAVVFIPAAGIPEVIHDCVESRVRAVCIESGGFADAGPEGERLQEAIVKQIEGTSTRLWGPNCAGYVSTAPPLSTSFVVTPGDFEAGNVALVAQSGMMAAALLAQILSQGQFNISKACSIGNKCDVDESDLLEHLADDPRSEVIALYVESIVDGPRFAAAADLATERGSNLLALVGGLSDAGADVAQSHTGSIGSNERFITGLLRQHGILQCDDFVELTDVAGSLSSLSARSCGNRVAVLTCSGAGGVVSADLFERHGLHLAAISEQTHQRLAEIFPPWFEPRNPVDVWSTVEQEGLGRTLAHSLAALLDDDGVDAVLFMPLAFSFFPPAELDHFAELARASDKPISAWIFGEDVALQVWQDKLRAAGVAVGRSLKTAVRVLEALVLRRDALERRTTKPCDKIPALDLPPTETIGEVQAKRILAGFGIAAVPEREVASADEAVAAADAIGYPAVLKTAAEGVTHKTDSGGVRVGLDDAKAVRQATEEMNGNTFVVQAMVSDGVEMIVGSRRDPRLGPMVIAGVGGVVVEALQDVTVRPAPVSAADATAMVAELRGAEILDGFRGQPPADKQALVDAVVAMSSFICSQPSVAEAEVNPLLVRPAGKGAVAVDGLIIQSTGGSWERR